MFNKTLSCFQILEFWNNVDLIIVFVTSFAVLETVIILVDIIFNLNFICICDFDILHNFIHRFNFLIFLDICKLEHFLDQCFVFKELLNGFANELGIFLIGKTNAGLVEFVLGTVQTYVVQIDSTKVKIVVLTDVQVVPVDLKFNPLHLVLDPVLLVDAVRHPLDDALFRLYN